MYIVSINTIFKYAYKKLIFMILLKTVSSFMEIPCISSNNYSFFFLFFFRGRCHFLDFDFIEHVIKITI